MKPEKRPFVNYLLPGGAQDFFALLLIRLSALLTGVAYPPPAREKMRKVTCPVRCAVATKAHELPSTSDDTHMFIYPAKLEQLKLP